MGTEVLRPQDILMERLRVSPAVLPRRKPYAGNTKPCRKPANRPELRKRSPQFEQPISRKLTASSDDSKSTKDFDMRQVTILKRGESLDAGRKNEILKKNVASTLGTERLRLNSVIVSKQIGVAVTVQSDVYAGAAFYLSPSPSSLPLPTFSKKKDGMPMIVDDSATKDLRRLLRLD